ncbi:MAG: hypothetical protein U0575_11815, partial [Phycisphaerales bacterium]
MDCAIAPIVQVVVLVDRVVAWFARTVALIARAVVHERSRAAMRTRVGARTQRVREHLRHLLDRQRPPRGTLRRLPRSGTSGGLLRIEERFVLDLAF